MATNKSYIEEYIRVMNSIDMSEQSKARIAGKCFPYTHSSRIERKPAIAAISCAAVLVAVGTVSQKIYKSRKRVL